MLTKHLTHCDSFSPRETSAINIQDYYKQGQVTNVVRLQGLSSSPPLLMHSNADESSYKCPPFHSPFSIPPFVISTRSYIKIPIRIFPKFQANPNAMPDQQSSCSLCSLPFKTLPLPTSLGVEEDGEEERLKNTRTINTQTSGMYLRHTASCTPGSASPRLLRPTRPCPTRP